MTWPEKYLGIAWQSGGRTLTGGLDCWGLLRHIYAVEFGIALAEYPVPLGTIATSQDILYNEIEAGFTWSEIEGITPGDVVALGNAGGFSHVGVYVEVPEPSIIHIARDRTSCIASLRTLVRQGFHRIKYYRHVDRNTDR